MLDNFHPKDIEKNKLSAMLMYVPIFFIIPYSYAWVSKFGRANIKTSAFLHTIEIILIIAIRLFCTTQWFLFLYGLLLVIYLFCFICIYECSKGKVFGIKKRQ